MDIGTVLSVAQTLFGAFQSSELKQICSILGYKSQLESLERTVDTVRKVLLDAELLPELSNQAERYIEELKDAVYDCDDLLDEFVTLAERKHRKLAEGHGKVSEKVRHFFSHFKDLGVAYNMSQGVKAIRKKLDAIASNHNQYGFKLDARPIRKQREDTSSYVYAQEIIGREEDVDNIVAQLLGSVLDQQDVSFLSIVGIGGLGKTTLAQLVYNDDRVTTHFDLRAWACVSDEDQKYLDVKVILGKILESVTHTKHDGFSMDVLQGQLRKNLAGKKYLLVLDDVWNENRDEWLKLEKFFRGGLKGSWVVVTTRSKETARVVDNGHTYVLWGLSEKDSWHLFERMAFGKREGEANNQASDLVEVGQKIVKKCANVPLAIRVVGSLLYGQSKDKWQLVQETGLAKIRPDKNGILPILKLSYHHLQSPLKSCFSYCAVFPKDLLLEKDMLISLWMAQGYIVPLDEGQCIEDAAEEYFLILMSRCFFQDVKKDEFGEIWSCKMHDLMHDIAQEVAGKEGCAVSVLTKTWDRRTPHISLFQEVSFAKSRIRTLLRFDKDIEFPVGSLLENCKCLRTLDLKFSSLRSLPDTIGKLVHLRYLDLSFNDMKVLPKSITKLHNLQALLLVCCSELEELPNDLSKLVKLRVLKIAGCPKLTHMPSGMRKLSHLHRLTEFVVGESNSSSKPGVVDQLEDLEALTNLKGNLVIRIAKNAAYAKGNDSDGGGYLRSKQHLNDIAFNWVNREIDGSGDYQEALMEDLEPHNNLKGLSVGGYQGKRMPFWIREGNLGTCFTNLVKITFSECHELQYLPSFGKLRHLRCLSIRDMRNLEYMELNTGSSSSSSINEPGACASSELSVTAEDLSVFTSLEQLHLYDLPMLKGWWRDGLDHDQQHQLLNDSTVTTRSGQPSLLLTSFPRLTSLWILRCPELTWIPLCPSLKFLSLIQFNERLQILMNTSKYQKSGTTSTCSSNPSLPLRSVYTDNVRVLMSVLQMEAIQCFTNLVIKADTERESLEVGELFQSCSSSLQFLSIERCKKLKSPSPSSTGKEVDDNGMPWRCLHQSLRSLELTTLPGLVKLPKEMQYLTSLQSLIIRNCKAMESLPDWMQKLTSLSRLEVRACSESLMQRCKSPTGEDWNNIQHIPNVIITKYYL